MKKILLFTVILIAIFAGLQSEYQTLGKIEKNIKAGYANLAKGRDFTCSWGWWARTLALSSKKIPPESKVFYWSRISGKERSLEIPAECTAMYLNYHLHPVTVYYENPEKIEECEYIICDEPFYLYLKDYLRSLGIQDKFRITASDRHIVIFKREEPSFPSENSCETRKSAGNSYSLTSIIFKLAGLFLSLLLPALAMKPFWKSFGLPQLQQWIFAFLAGESILTLMLFLLNLAGVPVTVMTGIIILLILRIVSAKFANGNLKIQAIDKEVSKIDNEPQKSSDARRNFPRFAAYAFIILFFLLIFILSMTKSVSSLPGIGIWGYKARVIAETQNIPASLFKDQSELFSHHSYPLGFPLMLAWSHLWMDGFDDYMIKLIPPILGLMIYLLLFSICEVRGFSRSTALILPLLLCANKIFRGLSTSLYADNILLIYLMAGFYLLVLYFEERHWKLLIAGFLFLGAATWIKNEGLIYFSLTAAFVIIAKYIEQYKAKQLETQNRAYSGIYQTMLIIAIFAMIFILPWQLFKYYMDIPTRDFAVTGKIFSLPDSYAILKAAVSKFSRVMFLEIDKNCGIWYAFILILVLFRKKLLRHEHIFLMLMIFISIVIFAISFIFSTRPLDWHMESISRILIIPTMLAWLIICFNLNNNMSNDVHVSVKPL